MSASTPPCVFCEIVAGNDPGARIVFRDEYVTAFFPLHPATRGHTLVVPNRHVPDLRTLGPDEAQQLGGATLDIGQGIWDAVGAEGLNVIQSNGAAATQSVPHLHVHLIPRWTSDSMMLQWPTVAAEDGPAQDLTLAAITAHVQRQPLASPEDRRQHLAFIQAVITRMAQASSAAKTWLLPIVTASYGYALTGRSAPVALLGLLAVLIFGILDANYLKQERAFRKLYDRVARRETVPEFALTPALPAPASPANANYWPNKEDLRSWAVAPVYGPLAVIGVAIAVYVQWH